MEKLFLNVLSWVGLTSYFGAVFLNIGNWKGDLLSVFGFGFILLKFIRLTLRTWQDYRKEELNIKEQKNKIEKGA